jgi:hypothetical protein
MVLPIPRMRYRRRPTVAIGVLCFQLNSGRRLVWVSNCQLTWHERADNINSDTTGNGRYFGKHKGTHATVRRLMVHPHARLFDVAHSWPLRMQALRPPPARALVITARRLLLLRGFYSQKGAVIFVRQQVKVPVRALPDLANSLP